jgi:hypothetical protein
MRSWLPVFLLLLQTGCITYYASPMEVKWLDKPAAVASEIELAVEVTQTVTDEFLKNEESSLAREARNYNRAVLDYMKSELESTPGVRPNPASRFKVIIASTVPESTRTSIPVGCLSVGTLYVFPGFATYEYPVEITLYSAGQKIKSYKYSYTAGFSIGWLMMPLNLIVTPFNENLSATDDGRREEIGEVFAYKVARANRWILKDFHEIQQ